MKVTSGREWDAAADGGPPSVPDFVMDGVSYGQVDLPRSFALRPPLSDEWRLYLVRGRTLLFEAEDLIRTRFCLEPGSVVALSGTLPHSFSSADRDTSPPTGWVETELQADAPGTSPSLAVGRIARNRLIFLAVFERVIVISSAEHPTVARRIAHALNAIAEEGERPGRESEVIVRKLSEIIALEIGRFRQIVSTATERSAQHAEADPRILRAISAFYAAPEEKWSLERLAAAAGMSRTAFAVRYRELIGATPAKSLRHLRLQIATRQLAEASARPRLDATARNVGYGSSAALVRAFVREFGERPKAATIPDGRP